jgi:phosphoribosyl 1,2-cyclic phosphate phosphodiesterase
MQVTILGSGDAAMIPRADCDDPACACARARAGSGSSRRNTCALVEADGLRVAIDTGCGPQACDALLLTHYHSDHAGWRAEFAVPAWGPDDGIAPGTPGTVGIDLFPRPERVAVVAPFARVEFGAITCTALPLNHPVPVLGWVVESGGRRVAWLTDTYGIPARSLAWLADHPCDVVCLDTTFAPGTARAPLKGHGDLTASLAALAASNAGRGVLIHVGHGLQNWLDAHPQALPESVVVAEDGMRIGW